MTPEERITAMSDEELVALCIWREARSDGHAGMMAVANVIHNRVKRPRWWGKDWRSVVLYPKQFSCFNPPDAQGKGGDPQYAKFPEANDVRWADALAIAHEVMTQPTADTTSGATHYLTAALLKTAPPVWAQKYTETARIGGHVFFFEA